MKKLTVVGKLSVVILFVLALFGIKWLIMDSGYVLQKETKQSEVIQKIDLPDAPKNAQTAVQPVDMPGTSPASLSGPEMRWQLWAWNAQMGVMFANGGPITTENSLMAKQNVKLHLIRQDDVPQMQASLLKFAQEYKNNPNTTEGVHFVSIMGDGAAQFLAGVNPQLEKLGKEYRAQVIYTAGRSLGEDKFMGLPAWRDNPQSAKGALVAAYLRDGDWNIVVKWCGDNGIPVNPDEKTYDPDAMNFVSADSYIDASEKYINGYKEDRPVVKNGKRSGDTKTVEVNGVATWTPGDVIVAEKKGGLVSIVSTKEYRSQMPCVVIGIKKWMEDNRDLVERMLVGIGQGGDQVKSYSNCLDKAGEISAKVYNEESGPYWVKYYKGVTQTDKQGQIVELGGSRVNNLGDNLEIFGLAEGSTNIFKVVYTLFGDLVVKMYPSLVPGYPPADDIMDLSYLKNIASKTQVIASADKATFNADDAIQQKVAQRTWSIEFETGKANFTARTQEELNNLFSELVVASNLKVEIHGYTDNVGDPNNNLVLSQARAVAIKKWLEQKSPNNFPEGRVNVFAHGQGNPIADNSTADGRAKNRRVEIVMGK
jgi:outer membrane protein OmpA-like peptidoglycan-associated protein